MTKEERIAAGVLRILKTETSAEKLNAALDVIEEFKRLESNSEFVWVPFMAWQKLEQLEEALRLLTGRDAESVKDETMLAEWHRLHPENGNPKA